MNIDGISCYCATYGRPKFILENSIQCFLNQDWPGQKELVILNDCKYQTFIFDHPQVKILNIEDRIPILGKKFNETIKLCKYNFLAAWEDDDTFLSHRLSYSTSNLYKNLIFHTYDGFVERQPKKLIRKSSYFHSTHILDKNLFEDIGMYDEVDVRSVDVKFMLKIKKKLGAYSHKTSYDNLFYIYSWLSNSYHASSENFVNKSISKTVEKQTIRKIDNGEIESGKIKLVPKLRYNFENFLPKA